MSDPTEWTLDRKIQVGAVLAVATSICGLIWQASKADSALTEHGRSIASLQARLDRYDEGRAITGERLIRLEEQGRATLEAVRRIEARVDSISSNSPNRRTEIGPLSPPPEFR